MVPARVSVSVSRQRKLVNRTLPMNRPIQVSTAAAAVTLLLCLGACASPAPSESRSAGPAPSTGAFPLTLENCGLTIKLDAAPKRVVATSLPALETAVAVGAADRIVGTAGVIDSLLPQYREQATSLKVISPGGFPPPSKEAVLGADPDFVIAGYEFDFNPNALGDRAALATSGLQSYLSAGECAAKPTVDDAMADVRNYGKLFGAEAKADELARQIQQQVDSAPRTTGKPKVLVIMGQPSKPAINHNPLSHDLLARLGALDALPDQKQSGEVSWEAIIAAKPDAIVISSIASSPADKTIEWIKKYAPAASIPAVKNDRFIVVPSNDLMPGVRTGEAIQKLAAGLKGL